MSGKENIKILLFNKWETGNIEINESRFNKGHIFKSLYGYSGFFWST